MLDTADQCSWRKIAITLIEPLEPGGSECNRLFATMTLAYTSHHAVAQRHLFSVFWYPPSLRAGAGAQRGSQSGATVSTTVVDPAGAIWPRASVVLIDTRTLEVQRVTADAIGAVHFLAINPGNYVLIAAPHPPIDCADSPVKQLHLKPGVTLRVRLAIRVDHCKVVE